MLPAAAFGVYLADVRRLRLLQCTPSKLSSPQEIDLWARYVLSDALERVLREFADGESAGGGGSSVRAAKRSSVVPLLPAHPGSRASSAGVGCPVMRLDDGASGALAVGADVEAANEKPRDLSPQVYAAMDVDERTDGEAQRWKWGWCGGRDPFASPRLSVVHKYMPADLLALVESVLRGPRCASRARPCCSSTSRASTR